ncbi:MAG: DUF853 family protein [Bergeyella sp.]|nr:DUF853 family protein [Bergeyella sp.]
MQDKAKFIEELTGRYSTKGDQIMLGKAMLGGEIVLEVDVALPLKTINRHGLIAGATGTGKTKTLQVFAEQLSRVGVPSLVLDIKGDFSGIAEPGEKKETIEERYKKTRLLYSPQAFPVELMTISGAAGVKLRATVEKFGPVLLSKILGLNDTQSSIISIIFKYCEDQNLSLVSLGDLKKVLQYVNDTPQGRAEISTGYGAVSSASLRAIFRAVVSLEQQGGALFFGEPSFDVWDLLKNREGKGVVNILRVDDIQSKPQLFSTFMLFLFSQIYSLFPEEGDAVKPKFVLFIDEAHLIFREASKTLQSQIETMVKLIRSKGVGIYFITQIPEDIPGAVLSQLGLKIQHALRGFTAKDRKKITKAIENYPVTEYYNASNLIQNLGIGEAFITALDEKGVPTPLVHTYLISPESRMDVLSDREIKSLVAQSSLVAKYENPVKINFTGDIIDQRRAAAPLNDALPDSTAGGKQEKGVLEQVLASSAGKIFINTVVRRLAEKLVASFIKKGQK